MKRPTLSRYSFKIFGKIFGFVMLAALSGQVLLGASLAPVTNCVVDGSPVSCSPGSSAARTFFSYNDGLGSPNLFISVLAEAIGLGISTLATAEIDLTFYATTAGPVRPGLATIVVIAVNDGSGGNGSAHASVSGLISCTSGPYCFESGDFPFTLGVPFQITMQASAFAPFSGEGTSGSGQAWIELSLYELAEDGSLIPVNILGPVDIPEPNQFGAVLFAALTGIAWNLRGRRKAWN